MRIFFGDDELMNYDLLKYIPAGAELRVTNW
jgi:hypothetical protein